MVKNISLQTELFHLHKISYSGRLVNNMSLQTEFFHLHKTSNSGTTQPNQACFATF